MSRKKQTNKQPKMLELSHLHRHGIAILCSQIFLIILINLVEVVCVIIIIIIVIIIIVILINLICWLV